MTLPTRVLEMRRPGTHNITITIGRTYRQKIQFPYDCTDHALYASCVDPETGVKNFDFSIEWIDQTQGLFWLVADKTDTAGLVRNGIWDLLVVQPNGESFDQLEGNVEVDRAATQEPQP